jgi:hypothetical protein
MQPELVAEVTLYPTGGRKGPISPALGSMFSCPCMQTKEAREGRDCRMLLGDEPLLLGEPRKVGFVFLNPDTANIFKAAGKFYLWEGKIIGEAVVVPNTA